MTVCLHPLRPCYVAVPPPVVAGFEVDKAASEELEALLPAGARPCSCGRCQREVQQQQQPTADLDAMEMPYLYGAGKSSVKSKEHTGSESSKEEILPGRLLQGNGAAVAESTDSGLAAMNTNASGSQCFADAAPAGSSPSRVQLAQQQWREAMHSEVRERVALRLRGPRGANLDRLELTPLQVIAPPAQGRCTVAQLQCTSVRAVWLQSQVMLRVLVCDCCGFGCRSMGACSSWMCTSTRLSVASNTWIPFLGGPRG